MPEPLTYGPLDRWVGDAFHAAHVLSADIEDFDAYFDAVMALVPDSYA